MSVYFDSTAPEAADTTSVAITLGQASLGGTIGVRIIVDDAVLTSKAQALRALRTIKDRLVKSTWPVS